uniref:Glycoside hydrolase family 28 n=1 Tax=Extatosoma tiaratum TaxID=7024 RepID=A0A191XSZ2_EXTTI|nr:glycoside hydrolase family 28 [Extatosoma tiaratum]
MRQRMGFLAIFAVLAMAHVATAGDRRTITEPKTPDICTSLNATSENDTAAIQSLNATSKDDTAAIQKALDSCDTGKAVALSSGIFYSGPLTIPSGVSLLVDSGATLKAIPNPKLYDKGADTCGTIDNLGVGCKAFITILKANGSGIYGKGTIDGQGGAHINALNITWWKLSKIASEEGKQQNSPMLIQINNSVDITLYQIVLRNSPLSHVAISEANNLTIWSVIVYAKHASARQNGFILDGSQYVTIAHSNITTIGTGIAISALLAPSQRISVRDIHFSRGSGLTIGSPANYGINIVRVSNITMTILRNGLQISGNNLNGGLIRNISYYNICMYRVYNPIVMEMVQINETGSRTPEFKNVTINKMWTGSRGSFVFHGIGKSDAITVAMNDVHIARNSAWSVTNAQVTGNWEYDLTERHCPHNVNN